MPFPTRLALLRRALGLGTLALLITLALGGTPASALVLPPPADAALPGSSFQGADGNQDDAAPLADWQSFQAAGQVVHNPDPNAQDTAFKGGSKEDQPGSWDFTTENGGVNPGKSNILDAWSSTEVSGGEVFLYLGFTRQDADGTTYLTFELNHDGRLWNNGNADIPCRRTGDLLVTYIAHGNGVEVLLQRWVTDSADAATGCATTGHLGPELTLTPDDVQGAFNLAPIASHLPGYLQGTIDSEHFGEAALNLTRIFGGAGSPCFSFGSIWMHSRSSEEEQSEMQDYVAPHPAAVRSCSASGTKFHDLNGNGARDAGEPGLPRWVIWADYNDNGVQDANEPFTVTDDQGQYVLNDIRPPDGTYTLRETLLTRKARRRAKTAEVTCSFPNDGTSGGTGSAPGGLFPCGWGPIDVATTPDARNRDFGNYRAAQLTVVKQLEPTTDLGRFDLAVNGDVWVPSAADGSSSTRLVKPGSYVVSETAVPPTDPLAYTSTVECKLGTRRRVVKTGTVDTVVLQAGQSAVCTFRNIRPGVPAIAIDKTGPASAVAGDTLHYTIFVTNPGQVAFPATGVQVTDPNCDSPPQLTGKADASGSDDTPDTLDPGDTWTYTCSHATTASATCAAGLARNTATVSGSEGGSTVTDVVTIETELSCPPTPGEPQPPEPPDVVIPPGPTPPDSGDSGLGGVAFPKGCVRGQLQSLRFHGTRIALIHVLVNGRVRSRLAMQPLQRRATARLRLAPGLHRLLVHVFFEHGTQTPNETLRGAIRVCAVKAVKHTKHVHFVG